MGERSIITAIDVLQKQEEAAKSDGKPNVPNDGKQYSG